MNSISDKSVDMILCDLPYGTTKCKWDNIIPFNEMWKRLNKLIKPNGAICLFGSDPFSSKLRMSNIKNFLNFNFFPPQEKFSVSPKRVPKEKESQ